MRNLKIARYYVNMTLTETKPDFFFFFFPGGLLQIKEFVIFVLAQILLEKGKGEVVQNVCSLPQETGENSLE